MTRTVYVNGEFVGEEDARVSVFDRGFLFADGVYEVSSVVNGRLVDNAAHLKRLHRSLTALDMECPVTDAQIEAIQQQLIALNELHEGLVYLQVTRGVADRNFDFPKGIPPSLVMFTQVKSLIDNPKADQGLSIITLPDIRWARRDIKTVGLLAPCMAKTEATRVGADDAWFVEDGWVTEGSSNNAYIITHDNLIVTRQLGTEILHGITRNAVLGFAGHAGYRVEQRPFRVQEAYAAKEAFITSASTFVLPVVNIDGNPVGEGTPGPVVRRLRNLYIDMLKAD